MTDRAQPTDSGRGEPDEDPREEPPDAERSVLSSLPRTRPAVRSPRRDLRPQGGTKASGTEASGGRRGPEAGKKTTTKPAPESEQTGATGLEDIALGGVRAATEVAGAGFRIGRWAAGTLRDAVRRD